jgi:DNA-binding beta-propeller fold protein YncE
MPQDPDVEQNGVEMSGQALGTGRTMEVGLHPRRRVLGRRVLRWAAVALTLGLAWAGLASPPAGAAVGDLAFTSCIGQLTECTATSPAGAVSQPRSVAVSPDGKSAYVASANAIDVFSRDTTTGALTFTSCIGQLAGCTTTTPAGAVFGAESVVVSPDGKSVYAASYNAGAIDVFSRDTTTGALTFTGCIGQLAGCTKVAAVNGPFSVALSADGASVYVADNTYQSIDAFSRDTTTGALTFESCVGQGAGCTTTVPALAVKSPVSVAVSPDGASVYAGSNAESGVDVFSRDTTTGELTFKSCIGTLAGCTPTSPAGAVGASYAVTVSPDGANVYSGDGGSVLSTFSRATGSGALTFTGCVGQLVGCATTSPPGAVESPVSVTVSPDGASVYVAADGANAVDVFSRSTSGGALTFTGCVGLLAGCAATTAPAGAVEGPQGVAITPDGASIYAVSVDSNTVEEFVRSLATCSDITATVAYETATPLALTCSDSDGDPLTYAITSAPAHGTLGAVSPSGQVTYTPAAGYSGTDSFTFTASDAGGTATAATAHITVGQPPASSPSNQSPAATVTGTVASATTAGVASTPQAIEELLLGCSKHDLVLNDVYIHGGRVAIAGSAAKSLAGKKVKILFNERKQVATATVLASGQYSTTAPLPPARIRENLTTRYTAVLGNQLSLHLKLTSRLLLEPPKASGTTVTLTGEVTPPLTKPIAPIVVEQQLECGRTTIVKRVTPPANGRFHITLTVPAGARAGIYRLKSSVAANLHATKHGFTTFSLPLPIALG